MIRLHLRSAVDAARLIGQYVALVVRITVRP